MNEKPLATNDKFQQLLWTKPQRVTASNIIKTGDGIQHSIYLFQINVLYIL